MEIVHAAGQGGQSEFDMPDKILVADDCKMNRKLMKCRLRALNSSLEVHSVSTPEKVLSIYKEYDIIIIDENFGSKSQMKGSEAIAAIVHSQDRHPCTIISWSDDGSTETGADFAWPKVVDNITIAEAMLR